MITRSLCYSQLGQAVAYSVRGSQDGNVRNARPWGIVESHPPLKINTPSPLTALYAHAFPPHCKAFAASLARVLLHDLNGYYGLERAFDLRSALELIP